jgi:hypothetical protein
MRTQFVSACLLLAASRAGRRRDAAGLARGCGEDVCGNWGWKGDCEAFEACRGVLERLYLDAGWVGPDDRRG